MAVNIKPLLDAIDARNAETQSTLDSIRSVSASGIAINKDSHTFDSYYDLPLPEENMGRLVYLTSNNTWVYSNGVDWGVNNTSAELWSWGANTYGELGTNNTTSRSSPGTTVAGDARWSKVAVSKSFVHTLAIKTDGTLWTWGYNITGQLGDGTTTSRRSPGTTAGGGTNWSQVSASSSLSAAIKTDGTLWTWGDNSYNRLGDGTTTNRSSPGTTAGGGTNWSQVSAGGYSTAAVKTDGTLWTWGRNADGQLGTGNTTSRSSPGTTAGGGTNWSQVSVGSSHTGAIKIDGTLWTWGWNGYGRLGDGTTTGRSSPGTTAGGGTNWSQVSAGTTHTLAIKTDGTLWTWGRNTYGKLGDGTTTDRSSPGTTAGGGTNWSQVSAGYDHITAIKIDGTLWTWGRNTSGQLGTNNTTSRSSPGTTAGGRSNWVQVSAGYNNTFAIEYNI